MFRIILRKTKANVTVSECVSIRNIVWEKSRIFRFGSYESFLSKGQNSVGRRILFPPPPIRLRKFYSKVLQVLDGLAGVPVHQVEAWLDLELGEGIVVFHSSKLIIISKYKRVPLM